MRSRISIRGCVRRSVCRSVPVGPSHTRSISEKWAKSEQNSIRNKKVCHLKDDSKTSTWAVRQRTHLLSELCSTCFHCATRKMPYLPHLPSFYHGSEQPDVPASKNSLFQEGVSERVSEQMSTEGEARI